MKILLPVFLKSTYTWYWLWMPKHQFTFPFFGEREKFQQKNWKFNNFEMKCFVAILLMLLLEIISLSDGELTIEGSLEWNGNGFNENAVQVKIVVIISYLTLLSFTLNVVLLSFSPWEGQLIKKESNKKYYSNCLLILIGHHTHFNFVLPPHFNDPVKKQAN